ncbi:MAG TPA: DNA polymerase Y family protein [Steroidobacteraceae bacterium]|nr:DNA polymerase Y family protein [Steroidobacteraceae bacterium]
MSRLPSPGAPRPRDAAAGMQPEEAQPHLTPARRTAQALRALTPAHVPGAAAGELWVGVHLPVPVPADALQRLALRAGRYTPRVSLEPPDGLLLEVKGSLHLFAGAAGVRRAVTDECRHLELPSVLAFAPTPLAALALARAGKPRAVLDRSALIGQLAPLPLETLRWPGEILARLARSGVRTIGAALRLPRGGFARRFGLAQLAALDALTGRTRDLRQAFRARVRFRRRHALSRELEQHPAILTALTPLLADLGTFLRAHQYGVLELECLLEHRHSPPTRCLMRLAAPVADAGRLGELLGERLSVLTLPEPVRGCELRSAALVPRRPDCPHLWQPGEHGGGLSSEASGLLELLRVRLGEEAIYGLTLLEGHRPEKAWGKTAPPATAAGSRATPGRDPLRAARRPLWLLPAPQSLPVRDGLPRRCGPLRLIGEPERIETGWWDGDEIARDYYTAADPHGVLLWVFRDRAAPHGWYLHGVFG